MYHFSLLLPVTAKQLAGLLGDFYKSAAIFAIVCWLLGYSIPGCCYSEPLAILNTCYVSFMLVT